MWITDRSRYETYVTDCQFKRWIKYEAFGGGLVPLTKSYHLEVGVAVHLGIAHILKYMTIDRAEGDEYVIDSGVDRAIENFKVAFEDKQTEFQQRGFLEEEANVKGYYLREGLCLIEGLIRVWAKVELPYLLSKYEVVLVEQEINEVISEKKQILLMSTADAILKEKKTDTWVVYSVKTARNVDDRLEKSQEIAMQNFTEVANAATRVKRLIKAGKIKYQYPAMWAVRYCSLVKGYTKKNEEMGRYEIEGPLVRYWKKKEDTKAKGPQYTANGHYLSEYGDKKYLYWQGYEKKYVWRMKGGVKRYLELIEDGVINPGDDLWREIVVTTGDKIVSLDEVRRNLMEFIAGELEVKEKMEKLRLMGVENEVLEARRHFRRNYRSCTYPQPCEMLEFCDNATKWENPLEFLVKRKPHHEYELVQIKGLEKEK